MSRGFWLLNANCSGEMTVDRTINNIAYLVPILTNVLLGRKTMHRGPFFMGNTVGITVNVITVAWLVFAIVFFSFPYYMPATGKYCIFCVGRSIQANT